MGRIDSVAVCVYVAGIGPADPNWTTIRKAPPQINELTSQGVFMRWPSEQSNQFRSERQLEKFRD